MTATATIHPWAGYPIGADWEWHLKNNGGRGGTDYKVGAGVVVHSPCNGEASHLADGLNTIVVVRDGDGATFHMEENRSIIGSFPRRVALGEGVAYTGLDRAGIVRWPHIHEQSGATRHAFDEPAINPSYLVAAGNRTLAVAAHLRFGPSTDSPIYATHPAGFAVNAVEYVTNGTVVNGSGVWYGLDYGWVAATLTKEGVNLDGLTNVTPTAPVVPPIPVEPDPVVVLPTPPAPVLTPVSTPPVSTVPPAVTPTPVETPPATVTPTPPKPATPGKTPSATPATHPAAAPVFVAIVAAVASAIGILAAWLHTL